MVASEATAAAARAQQVAEEAATEAAEAASLASAAAEHEDELSVQAAEAEEKRQNERRHAWRRLEQKSRQQQPQQQQPYGEGRGGGGGGGGEGGEGVEGNQNGNSTQPTGPAARLSQQLSVGLFSLGPLGKSLLARAALLRSVDRIPEALQAYIEALILYRELEFVEAYSHVGQAIGVTLVTLGLRVEGVMKSPFADENLEGGKGVRSRDSKSRGNKKGRRLAATGQKVATTHPCSLLAFFLSFLLPVFFSSFFLSSGDIFASAATRSPTNF